MSSTLRVRNWDKWQSYRRDRGQPPWIKVHREVMRNHDWVSLTDAQRGQLVAIWLLAADRDGVIPASPELIKKLCFLDSEPDLELFIDHGFIDTDANVTPTRRQRDETETETETETEEEISRAKSTRVPSRHIDQIFACWQEKLNHPRAKCDEKRRRIISQALKQYSLDDLRQCIDGYSKSPFHRGHNDRGTAYDSIELILKDSKHIEQGMRFAESPPKANGAAPRETVDDGVYV